MFLVQFDHIKQTHVHSLMQSHAILLCVFYFQWHVARQDTTKSKIHAMHRMQKKTAKLGMSEFLRHLISSVKSMEVVGILPSPLKNKK